MHVSALPLGGSDGKRWGESADDRRLYSDVVPADLARLLDQQPECDVQPHDVLEVFEVVNIVERFRVALALASHIEVVSAVGAGAGRETEVNASPWVFQYIVQGSLLSWWSSRKKSG